MRKIRKRGSKRFSFSNNSINLLSFSVELFSFDPVIKDRPTVNYFRYQDYFKKPNLNHANDIPFNIDWQMDSSDSGLIA